MKLTIKVEGNTESQWLVTPYAEDGLVLGYTASGNTPADAVAEAIRPMTFPVDAPVEISVEYTEAGK